MKQSSNKNQKGFTLIEMLIVMVIIGVLVILAFPQASSILQKTNETGCAAYQESVEARKTANLLMGLDENTGIDPNDEAKVCK
ncbi:MAG: prepilin-type N-terminal cleavage/methylation domain-containing protein [Turicibacter sp.]|nr:prepilin-type N-terminal cleavage/methylation domain-containing protein [Turicibacter sp.]